MSAIDDGDDLVCTGSKIWTTHALVSNWMFALVRSSREAKPQRGITFVLLDMHSPGVSVRPIVMSSGEHIQNQVFFDQVRLPKRSDEHTFELPVTNAQLACRILLEKNNLPNARRYYRLLT